MKEVSDVQMLLASFFLFLSNKCFLGANLLEESQPEIFVIETETTYKPQSEDQVRMDLLNVGLESF